MNPTATDTQRLRELHGRTLADWEPPYEMHKRDAAFFTAIHREAPVLLDELEMLRKTLRFSQSELEQEVARYRIALREMRDAKEALKLASAERDKLREEVERLRVLAYNDPPNEHYPGTTWEDVADWNSFACVENQKLFAKAEAERDSLRRENEELKAKLK